MAWAWALRLGRVHIPGWVVLVVALAVLAALSTLLVALWGRSRRWAAASRLHRLAARNERALRTDARGELVAALRCLGRCARTCRGQGRSSTAQLVEGLIGRVELACDRVAADYVPSPANLPHGRNDVTLERVAAAQALREACEALDPHRPLAPQLTGASEVLDHLALTEVTG